MSWLGLAALIVAIVAMRRTRTKGPLVQRIGALEREVSALREDLARRQRAEPAPPTAEAKAPAAPSAPRAGAPGAPEREAGPAPEPRAPRPWREPTAPPPPRAPRSPRPWEGLAEGIEWERWIGVRGAAVLGGIVLALAGLYFFQYSIEHGLIPPWLRVVIGTTLGLACIAGAEWKARERYEAAANALVGGGIVVLYAAFWASRVLYELVGGGMAFALMISVTAACTALAYRHASLVIAMIGLIGGFATPLLLSTGENRPIALFSYILLLDACLLFIAQRRGWPILALVSLVGTLFYQAAWIGARMEADQVAIALGVLAVFAAAYAYALRTVPEEGRREWLVTQGGAALFPFFFAVYLAARTDLGEHIYPLGLLLALLSASASWLGRAQQRPWLGLAAACGTTAVALVWMWSRSLGEALAWESVGVAVLLAAVFHAFVELDREPAGRDGPAPAAMVSSLGLFTVLLGASVTNHAVALWPWLVGWLALAALVVRHGTFPRRGPLQLVAALAVGIALSEFRWDHETAAPGFAAQCAVAIAVAVAAQLLAHLRRAADAWTDHAAALLALILVLSLVWVPYEVSGVLALGAATLLGFLAIQSATRIPAGAWLLAAVVTTALAHSAYAFDRAWIDERAGEAARIFALQLASFALFAAWPLVVFRRLRADRFAWYAAALAGPAWFLSLRELHEVTFGTAAIGLLPIGLGAVALAQAQALARWRDVSDPLRTSNLAWFLAVAFGFVTVAIPLQLEKEWITIGWALEALAVSWLWRRLDHPGLKYLALALFAGVTVRLVANEAVLGYYPRPEWRIVNWLLYTYMVPAAALVVASRLLQRDEVSRARDWEAPVYEPGHAVGAIGAGVAAVAVVFVWINLAIADWFATGDTLRVSFERMPARDLATSIAWALYALLLLAIGVRGESRGLRWLSLGLMLVTSAKVFLYDLGELEDLYRVASLLGLAVSLIAISLAYQRFVVSRPTEEDG
jgi:uncharacterized membrane protein